jgi:hypothetical protein
MIHSGIRAFNSDGETAMIVNEGAFDRGARVVVGIQMMALGLSGVVAGNPGLALILIGTMLVSTGIAGRCLLYRMLGVSTVRKERRFGPPDRREAQARRG